jgi:hypothetical protein
MRNFIESVVEDAAKCNLGPRLRSDQDNVLN